MMESTATTISKRQREILVHMLGAESMRPGYRNRFFATAGGSDYCELLELERAGMVEFEKGQRDAALSAAVRGDRRLVQFHATTAGCQAIGLGEAQIRNAMDF